MAIQKLQRVFGLDLLRSLAIVIVTLSHSSSLLATHYPDFPFLPLPDGVDIFFALSGFLIGSILIRSIDNEGGLRFPLLRTFLQRRWLRTLPNYFLFLLLNIVLVSLGLINGTLNKYLAAYFIFFQNFFKPLDFLFWESWSLSVEEWFYILFPMLLFTLLSLTKQLKAKQITLATILLFLLLPLVFRILVSKTISDPAVLDLYVRKLVVMRLDCIAYGLLAAFIKHYCYAWWDKARGLLFTAGVLLTAFLVTMNGGAINEFSKVWYFSLVGLSVMLWLPWLDGLKDENIPLRPFGFISRISYSMYLLQIPLFQVFSRYYAAVSLPENIVRFLFYWLALIVFSALIYKYFEKPFLKLRQE